MGRAKKILLAGAPGAGKTTLAGEVNVLLKMAGKRSEVVPEYARAYIAECGLPQHAYEQLLILEGQIRNEEELAGHADFLVADSSSWYCYVFARRLAPDAASETEWAKYRRVAHEIWMKAMTHLPSYDHTFWIPHTKAPIENDGLRHDEDFARDMERRLRGFLDAEGIGYTVVHGSLRKRAEMVLETLGVPVPRIIRPSRRTGATAGTSA